MNCQCHVEMDIRDRCQILTRDFTRCRVKYNTILFHLKNDTEIMNKLEELPIFVVGEGKIAANTQRDKIIKKFCDMHGMKSWKDKESVIYIYEMKLIEKTSNVKCYQCEKNINTRTDAHVLIKMSYQNGKYRYFPKRNVIEDLYCSSLCAEATCNSDEESFDISI